MLYFLWPFSIVLWKSHSTSILVCVPPKYRACVQVLCGGHLFREVTPRKSRSGSPGRMKLGSWESWSLLWANGPQFCWDPSEEPYSKHLRVIPSRQKRGHCLSGDFYWSRVAHTPSCTLSEWLRGFQQMPRSPVSSWARCCQFAWTRSWLP